MINISIHIYMGKTGSGKSTMAAKLAQKDIKKGRTVYSNVDILGTKRLDLQKDIGIYNLEDCTLIIDEAGLQLNSRNWKDRTQKSKGETESFNDRLYWFMTMHRHYNCDIYLFVQFWDRLDIVIRELVHRIFVCKPLIKGVMFTREIVCNISINKDSEQIQESFRYKSILSGGLKFHLSRSVWHMFNTIEKDRILPEKEWTLWGEYKPKESIFSKLHKLFMRNTQENIEEYIEVDKLLED